MKKSAIMIVFLISLLLLVSCVGHTSTIAQPNATMENTARSANETETTADRTDAAGDRPVAIRLTVREALSLILAEDTSQERFDDCLDRLGLSYDREDTLAAVQWICSLPLVSVAGAEEKINLTYYPHLPAIYVSCAVDQNAWYRFEYVLNAETAKQTKEKIDTENMKWDASITTDQDITVLSKVTITDAELAKRYAEFWIDIDGYLVKMIYRNTEKDLSANRYDEMFSKLQVSLINELA